MGEKDAQITVARYFLEKIRGMMVTMRQPCGENRLGDGGNMNIEVGADGNMVINMATEDDGTGEHDAYRETLKAAFTLCRMRYRGDD